jgi:SAM-dependent methyltransferase
MQAQVQIENARTLYEACPLCTSSKITDFLMASCQNHPLYKPSLPNSMKWRLCLECNHSFTEGYYTDEALGILFQDANAGQTVGNNLERDRIIWAKVVDRVNSYLDKGRVNSWLDVGFGNGSLLFTAQEWGMETAGVELRETNVEAIKKFGVEAWCVELANLDQEDRFDVISMADVLEHMPYPGEALEKCRSLLRKDGVVFISMPNMDTVLWRLFDEAGVNPYWGELEHYHNFTRQRLYNLLEQYGFTPIHYYISERYRACMEVIARKNS